MVRDPASGNGSGPPQAADKGSSKPSAQTTQAPPSNLTRELAQLLAASIAQNQANRGAAGCGATNADLTSLANLVSAERQRTLAPTFKDGLSALSYAPVQPRPAHGLMAETEPHIDDEPMPIPSTWRQPAVHDDQRWFRQQMGAAVLGLIAGLIIVVPSVLWLSGWLGPQKPKPVGASPVAVASSDSKAPEVKTVKVQVRPVERSPERQVERPPERQVEGAAQYVTGSIDGRAPADSPQPVQQQASAAAMKMAEARARAEEVLAQAKRRIDSGDVKGARELLGTAEDGGQGPALFMLAQTYDPEMLAAWGSRGVSADVPTARSLYVRALKLGVASAQARLNALPPLPTR